ncbi:hypothetical protein FB45DRAFT_871164 [Roridomyces roridus]|uniref:Uncharacterized protein n=1 Tax=Roridomyces roridus TaxID=1738132 RepID=A0AAD7FEX1_9AGAR|nr:hypothetical protein FB45DRAFT_871164 [Roridomyces roridus]
MPDETVYTPQDDFQAFLSHSADPLLRFSYHGFAECLIDFRWLDVAQNLTEIHLDNDSYGVLRDTYSEAVANLMRKLDRTLFGTFLPRLESLELEDFRFVLKPDALGQILSSRCDAELGGGLAPLHSFQLIGVSAGLGFEALSYLVGFGMNIHVGPDASTNLLV